jgi:dihydroneopterin aldolase
MSLSGVVSLEGMEFFAKHGYYEQEREVGNRYAVDVSVKLDVQEAAEHDKLTGTINYEYIYQIVSEVMNGSSLLLEHLASDIIHQIKKQFPAVEEVTVKVTKYNPPINGLCQRASVLLSD